LQIEEVAALLEMQAKAEKEMGAVEGSKFSICFSDLVFCSIYDCLLRRETLGKI
jgi:hypothetical protein